MFEKLDGRLQDEIKPLSKCQRWTLAALVILLLAGAVCLGVHMLDSLEPQAQPGTASHQSGK